MVLQLNSPPKFFTNQNLKALEKFLELKFQISRHSISDAFSPDFTPIGNLGRLLSAADDCIGFRKWTHMLPRWIVLENDSALCLFRNMTGEYGRCVEDYVPKKEVISRPHEVDVSVRERDLSLILDLMRELKSEPSDYYFDQMQDAEEVDSFVESMKESLIGIGPPGTVNVNVHVCVHLLLNHPQAAYIIVGLGVPGIGSPYGGYAYEMFLEDSFYSILDVTTGHMSGIWKKIIPKKKGVNLFSREKNMQTDPLAAYVVYGDVFWMFSSPFSYDL